jgi:hypothetical protein
MIVIAEPALQRRPRAPAMLVGPVSTKPDCAIPADGSSIGRLISISSPACSHRSCYIARVAKDGNLTDLERCSTDQADLVDASIP